MAITVSPGDTEDRLRETLDALAGQVRAQAPAYGPVRAAWQRRERRRRLLLALLIAVVFALADIIGLWALNQSGGGSPVIFDDRGGVHQPTQQGGVGQP